jgi:hypothetical protein
MKKKIFYFILLIPSFLITQIQPVGLQGMKIYSLAQYGDAVYAGTENGVYWLRPNFSYWQPLGLQGMKIKSVYPHQYGAIGTAITAAILRDSISSTVPLLYCTSDFGVTWTPSDSGITRNDITYLKDINGFPSPVICGETFAVSLGKVYKRYFNNPGWENILDLTLANLNVIEANQQTAEVWIGGIAESFVNVPLIGKSADKGSSWTFYRPDFPGTDACNSILFDNNDTNIVYAGLKNSVIKSVDKGDTWKGTGLSDTPYYFNALAQGHYTNIIFAGGSTDANEFGLFYSENGGDTWQQIVSVLPVIIKGISSLVDIPDYTGELQDLLYIGTMGDGIYLCKIGILDEVYNNQNNLNQYFLSQNYPNPFNPSTKISFVVPNLANRQTGSSFVTLKVFDVLGHNVATLVDEYKAAGKYSIEFNATNLSSGIYIYQLQSGKYILRKKMVVLK